MSSIIRYPADYFYIRLSDHLGPNQVCTLFGSGGGRTLISGRDYIAAGYGLDVDDLWRRCFLVLLGLTIALQISQIIALEFFPVGAEFISLIWTDPTTLPAIWRQPIAQCIR